jgi:hypothetical protein
MKRFLLLPVSIAIMAISSSASSVSYQFDAINADYPKDVGIGEDQFSFDVTNQYDPDGPGGILPKNLENQVMFIFKNSAGAQSTISEIYFDDDLPYLLNFDSFEYFGNTGIQFTSGAKPSDLPGGRETVSFKADYAYEPDGSHPKYGINQGEQLGILFNIADGKTYNDVISSLNANSSNSDFVRVGIHATNFADGGSVSFVSKSNIPVPEPGMISFLLLSLGGLPFCAFFFKRSQA